jgi:hypothetical protein
MLTSACGSACPRPGPSTQDRTGERHTHDVHDGIVECNRDSTLNPALTFRSRRRLVHLLDEVVDEVLAVAKVTTLDEVLKLAGAEATGGRGQLEGPEEVGGLLEVGADGVDLVDEVLNADDAVLAEVLLDQLVVSDGQTLLVDLAVAALVDELTVGLEVGVAVGDEGLDDLQHLGGGLGEADENTVVDLEETEELEGLALLGVDLVDTLDADDEGELGLGGNEEGAILLCLALGVDDVALGLDVLLVVLLGALEDGLALLLVGLRCLSQL